MFVDGNPGVRRFARKVLEREGFKVLVARNSVEALVLAADYPFPIDVLITEGGMRVYQNGMQLGECFGVLRPETRVLFTSRSGSPADLPEGPDTIAMPYSAEALTGAVARALELAPIGPGADAADCFR